MRREVPKSNTRPTIFRLLAIAAAMMLGTSLFVFVTAAQSFQLRSQYRMAKHGSWVEGWITAKTKDHGGNVEYAFQVNGRSYKGRGGRPGGIGDLEVGDPVAVVYDPANPGMSALGTSDQQFSELIVILVVASVLIGFVCTLFYTPLWYIWRLKRMKA